MNSTNSSEPADKNNQSSQQAPPALPQSLPPAPNPASPFTPEEEERYLKMHWELLDFNDGKIPEPQYPMEDFLRFRRWQGWNLLKDDPERQQAYVDRLRKNGLL